MTYEELTECDRCGAGRNPLSILDEDMRGRWGGAERVCYECFQEAIEDAVDGHGQDAWDAWVALTEQEEPDPATFERVYLGKYDTPELLHKLVYGYLEQLSDWRRVPEWVKPHIDVESMAEYLADAVFSERDGHWFDWQ